MTEFESWTVRAAIAAAVAGVAGVFMRLRTLESRRAANEVRLDKLERATPPDYHEDLKGIDERLRVLEARLGPYETLSQKVDGVARSLSHTDRNLGEIKGQIGEMRLLVHSINEHLRKAKK